MEHAAFSWSEDRALAFLLSSNSSVFFIISVTAALNTSFMADA
jgi:hypothetical protein